MGMVSCANVADEYTISQASWVLLDNAISVKMER